MKEKMKRRINVIGKIGRIISIVLIVLMFIAAAAITAVGTAAAFVPRDLLQVNAASQISVSYNAPVPDAIADQVVDGINNADKEGLDSLSADAKDGSISMIIKPNAVSLKPMDLCRVMPVVLLNLSGIIVCLFFFKALMNELRSCDSPFCEGVVQKMRNFAIALLPCAVVSSVGDSIFKSFIGSEYGFSLSINLAPVVTAGIIFILIMIFNYGVALQKESDETL